MPGELGKSLILIGVILVCVGVFLQWGHRIPLLGKLPGDLHFSGKNWSVSFPIVTCIVLSVLLTVLLRFFHKS